MNMDDLYPDVLGKEVYVEPLECHMTIVCMTEAGILLESESKEVLFVPWVQLRPANKGNIVW
jgi:hypothetical protein